MNKTELLKLVSDAYDYACEKHPFFAHVGMLDLTKKFSNELLLHQRKWLNDVINRECVSGIDVLECETAEAQEAYSRKDYAHCIQELAHCAAVILRMIEKVQEESKL